MHPRSGFRSGGTCECTLVPVFRSGGTSERTLVPVFVPGEHPPKPPFWKPPFWVPPITFPQEEWKNGLNLTKMVLNISPGRWGKTTPNRMKEKNHLK